MTVIISSYLISILVYWRVSLLYFIVWLIYGKQIQGKQSEIENTLSLSRVYAFREKQIGFILQAALGIFRSIVFVIVGVTRNHFGVAGSDG
ncbi:hypothetical protein RJT34_21784 [Clitoria ternatea]|uniref:Uncharacterized protein n=1 Tax=Clitoria ternatea TaxID=43366 RepID=A0AAN9IVV5_CLITE